VRGKEAVDRKKQIAWKSALRGSRRRLRGNLKKGCSVPDKKKRPFLVLIRDRKKKSPRERIDKEGVLEKEASEPAVSLRKGVKRNERAKLNHTKGKREKREALG